MRQRYVGVLTDGADWHLYHLDGGELTLVSSFTLDPRSPDPDQLCLWLEGVLATDEQITPTPHEIENRLGAASPAHALEFADLNALYQAHRDLPTVALKRQLWAKLLTTALGTAFSDEDRLFVEHTLLVTIAEIISHAVVGIDPADHAVSARMLVRGGLFSEAQIGGVVEHDFFDWVVEVPGGAPLVKTLARRLARFAWSQVEHDVMKVLYESVIGADERHRLGEYYTPDWLAAEIVSEVITEPLTQKVLDPGCGSGTFLFHSVRRFLLFAEAAGATNANAILGVVDHVMGVDVHPVAVTFARVTYLLAIGMERLQALERPAFTVPVYLGDSVQWGQTETLMQSEGLSISTDDGLRLFADELKFPERLLADAGRFDQLVSEFADKASARDVGSGVPSLAAVFRRFAVHPEDQEVLTDTFQAMCRLHDEGRDHIWGYYVRNLARPIWLAQSSNRVDVLIGNPPWLAYRYMTGPMQTSYRELSEQRNLWEGSTVATHQDLSGLFVVRCVELYLRYGGRFAFVMPLAALSRRQFIGFRAGRYPGERLKIAFAMPWDLHKVKPSFFPVPASVVFGERSDAAVPLTAPAETWSGRLPVHNASAAIAAENLSRATSEATLSGASASLYGRRFTQGATIVPRVLFMVQASPASAIGSGAGRRAIRSQRSATEKKPWKDIPDLDGTVEISFVRPIHLSDTVLPFRLLEPRLAVIPWDGKRLLTSGSEEIDDYPGLANWWKHADELWRVHQSSDRLSLLDRLDFRRGLTHQFPAAKHRVVYSKGGMYLAATRVSDPTAIIDHTLYWATASSLGEAHYLTALLNSDILTQRVRPLQARGEHNPRHFDKYIFRLPIPLYDPELSMHRRLSELSLQAETTAAGVDFPAKMSFQFQRRRIREALANDGVGDAINHLTTQLLVDGGR
jgi:SAM-dependent methyltransferase